LSVEDGKRSGQPGTIRMEENVEKVQDLIQEGHCRTIHELVGTIGIRYGVCQEILMENLKVHHIAPS
jgi:hypothetical protein